MIKIIIYVLGFTFLISQENRSMLFRVGDLHIDSMLFKSLSELYFQKPYDDINSKNKKVFYFNVLKPQILKMHEMESLNVGHKDFERFLYQFHYQKFIKELYRNPEFKSIIAFSKKYQFEITGWKEPLIVSESNRKTKFSYNAAKRIPPIGIILSAIRNETEGTVVTGRNAISYRIENVALRVNSLKRNELNMLKRKYVAFYLHRAFKNNDGFIYYSDITAGFKNPKVFRFNGRSYTLNEIISSDKLGMINSTEELFHRYIFSAINTIVFLKCIEKKKYEQMHRAEFFLEKLRVYNRIFDHYFFKEKGWIYYSNPTHVSYMEKKLSESKSFILSKYRNKTKEDLTLIN